MTIDEQDATERIRFEKKRRLDVLEAQAARSGYDTPAEIQLEIAELRADLGIVEKVKRSPISADVLEAIGPSGQFQALTYDLRLLGQRLDGGFQRIIELYTSSQENDAADRQRARGITRLFFGVMIALLFVLTVLVLAFFGFVIWLLSNYALTPR